MNIEKFHAMLETVNTNLQKKGFELTQSTSIDGSYETTEFREYTGNATLIANGKGSSGIENGEHIDITCITIHGYINIDNEEFAVSTHIGIHHTYNEDYKTSKLLYADEGIEDEMCKLLGVEVCFANSQFQDEFYIAME